MGLRAVANPLASGALPSNVTSASLNSITPTGGTLAVTGQASFAAGSAAAPSVKVGAEQNGLYSSAANTLSVALGGVESFRFGYVASAVNYGQFTGNSAGGYPSLRAAGSDTNIGFDFATQGAAPFRFYTSAFGAEQLRILSTASAVNYATITGSATGNAVTISGAGSDANIDFAIAPKGTGVLRFGTHSAIAAETVTGYITIKDSAGNTRKLAVVS